jgi:LL-diaminopimelate aminotransferase
MPAQSNRLANLPPYVFAVLGERLRDMQKQGIDVIRLDIGSPDLPPADNVIQSMTDTMKRPEVHGYAGYRGTPAFRQAIARYYQRRFNVTIDPETEVLPLIGSKEGIVNLCLAYLDHGDTALVPDIGYPAYSMGTLLAGGEVCWFALRPENGYLPDFESIPADVADKAKIIWLNYPNNPTRAVAFCKKYDILLASDNPYCDVTFDGYIAPSALQVPGAKDVTVEFMSFSKSYNMAGWRLGAAVGNTKALQTLLKVKSNMDSGHFEAIYAAGVTAVDETPQSWLDERNAVYKSRRNRMMAALPEMGLRAEIPAGSLYVWATPTKLDANTYVEEALTQAHVSLAPGGSYGPGGKNYLRFSVGMSDERIDEAIRRLKEWYNAKYA